MAAASRLFATRGFAATSIADVAEASGLLKGNLAYYFKTKQDLLEAVVEARAKALWDELVAPAQPGEDARATVGRLLDHVRASADELAQYGCPVGGLATELGKTDDALHTNAAGLLLKLEAYLFEAFAQTMQKKDAERAAEHLLARLQGAAVVAQARRDPAVVHRQIDDALTWLDTVLPSARRRRRA
ncbi:helix-turn-helix domain-containing protein [Roseateles asaccharophilus]|uniref:TetR/AcrR family transcriptional regulator n=1 Tax=Roseateles asaccharophilus TaxID=582607 RepID=UPI00286CA853|nr:helix-turn-helix domain-containing protein [Roseateles asaccharophilus]